MLFFEAGFIDDLPADHCSRLENGHMVAPRSFDCEDEAAEGSGPDAAVELESPHKDLCRDLERILCFTICLHGRSAYGQRGESGDITQRSSQRSCHETRQAEKPTLRALEEALQRTEEVN